MHVYRFVSMFVYAHMLVCTGYVMWHAFTCTCFHVYVCNLCVHVFTCTVSMCIFMPMCISMCVHVVCAHVFALYMCAVSCGFVYMCVGVHVVCTGG